MINFNRRLQQKISEKRLTICIAAICDEIEGLYPKIVFAADRLISAGIQFEHGKSKIERITDSTWVMMASNDSLKSDMIIKDTITEIADSNISVKEIVSVLSKQCEKMEKSEREKGVLSKFGLSYDTLIEKSRHMSQDFIRIVTAELEDYVSVFEANFIIFGLDPQPHIYIVEKDGNFKLHDFVGFAVIGSGYPLAFADMTKYVYHPSLSLAAALVRVYNAKKAAERIGGVGREFTDLYVLHTIEEKGKKEQVIWKVPEELMKILDAGIQTMKDKEFGTYVGIMKKIDEYFAKSIEKGKQEYSDQTKENLSS